MREDLSSHSPYGELVGTSIVRVDNTERTLEAAYYARHEFTNRIGIVSGGMLSAMLDSVTGLVALSMLPKDLMAAHTSLRVEYLRAAHPGRLIGRARVMEYTGRDIRSQGELFDSEGRMVARAEATLRVIRKEHG